MIYEYQTNRILFRPGVRQAPFLLRRGMNIKTWNLNPTLKQSGRDQNFRDKLNAKAKFFPKKMQSESQANLLLLNAKQCEANPFKNAKILRKFLIKL
jgi:hypothetical protein